VTEAPQHPSAPSDSPEPDGHPNEVFAYYGLSCYYAQVLEQELFLFAAMLHLSDNASLATLEIETLFDQLEGRTFGQLIHAARQLTEVPADLEGDLDFALRQRNELVHRFFAEHSEDLLSSTGRSEMITLLREAISNFKRVDLAVTALREPLSARLGITVEAAQNELDRMLKRAASRDTPEATPPVAT
jgi:hypothetical protein